MHVSHDLLTNLSANQINSKIETNHRTNVWIIGKSTCKQPKYYWNHTTAVKLSAKDVRATNAVGITNEANHNVSRSGLWPNLEADLGNISSCWHKRFQLAECCIHLLNPNMNVWQRQENDHSNALVFVDCELEKPCAFWIGELQQLPGRRKWRNAQGLSQELFCESTPTWQYPSLFVKALTYSQIRQSLHQCQFPSNSDLAPHWASAKWNRRHGKCLGRDTPRRRELEICIIEPSRSECGNVKAAKEIGSSSDTHR